MGAVVIQTTTESHSSVAQAGLEFPSHSALCVTAAGCHILAHSFRSLSLVADVAFCVFIKSKEKKLREVVFSKRRKFLGFIERHFHKKEPLGPMGRTMAVGSMGVATYR